MPTRRLGLFLFVAMCIGMGGVFFLTNVEVAVTEEDEIYIRLISAEIPLPHDTSYANASYSEKIAVIVKVAAYFDRKTKNTKDQAIPAGMTREPKDWYLNPTGVCYDLARVTEKFLQYYGFGVRHVAVYSTQEAGSPAIAFTRRRNPSHAVLEVLTERGWVLVDPHSGMVAVTKNGDPISARDARSKILTSRSPTSFHTIFSGPYFLVYGLYSRHGMLYPPFNELPDVSWADLVRNGCCVNVN
jgi:hypothetical protein